MRDIKTRNVVHDIKTFERRRSAGERMRGSFLETKNAVFSDPITASPIRRKERIEKEENISADHYAVQKVEERSHKAKEWSSKTIRNIIHHKRKAADHSRSAASFSYEKRRKGMVFNSTLNPGQKVARRKVVRDFQKTRVTAMTTKRTVQNIYRVLSGAVKAVSTAVKDIGSLLSSATVVVVFIIVIVIFCGFAAVICSDSATGNQGVSEEVLAYTPLIIEYAGQYDMMEYVTLIQAVMMQESGGQGLDPMQSSEGPYNKKYPKTPNGITDPAYSIEAGVQELKHCLEMTKVTSPYDIDRISLALQGYNFGNGYITWAVKNYGGYSESNALEFSQMMQAKLGWSRYGDPQYVPHVLRYYQMVNIVNQTQTLGMFTWPLSVEGTITSNFGYRIHPISGTRKLHTGIDIAAPKGIPVLASAPGTVSRVQYLTTGYGYNVMIDHGNGIETLYAHMSAIYVTEGQPVIPGQIIGAVGSTGASTGNHLHFEVRQDGVAVDPNL